MTKYYVAKNASQPVCGLTFEVTEISGGTAWGVYATDDPGTISALDCLIGKSSIQSISESEYREYLKKKPIRFANSKQSAPPPVSPTALPGVSLKGSGAVLVESKAVEPQEVTIPSTTLATVEEALVVAPVVETKTDQSPNTEPAKGRTGRGRAQ